MATTVNPKFSISLIGTGYTDTISDSITWTPRAKLEQSFYINSTDGTKTISLTDLLSDIALILIKGSNDFVVSISTVGGTVDHECSKFFILTPTIDFSAAITGLSIKTNITDKITIDVGIYSQV